MKKKSETLPIVSIEKWVKLCENGDIIPVQTFLSGVSMEPLINRGRNLVTVFPVNRPLEEGLIVLFRVNGTYMIHRIFRIEENTVQTWGDGCLIPDVHIPKENVIGIVHSMKKFGFNIILDGPFQKKYIKIYSKYFRKKWIAYKRFSTVLHNIIKNKKK